MPEVQGNSLDVSAAEQRFLKRCFRRFALPYVVGGVVLGALAGAAPGWISTAPAASVSGDDSHLREELGALRTELASLSQRAVSAEAALAKTRERLVSIEQRAGSGGVEGVADTAQLESRVDATTRRVDALEARIGNAGAAAPVDTRQIEDQLATLGSRLARIEGEQRAERGEALPATPAR
jgi:hypothetical protein